MPTIPTRSARLEAMGFGDLLKAYFNEVAVRLYIGLAVVCAVITLSLPVNAKTWISICAVLLLYPFIEYSLHRFVLHSRLLYRYKMTSALWKRIHFDHHRDPGESDVILGAIYTMLPAAVITTVPLGLAIGGLSGAFAALTTGLVLIALYELVHCSQHLMQNPRNRYLRLIKRMHMLHHYYNENGNFGVTSPICDYIFGTYYDGASNLPKSPTASNLGYTEEMAGDFPWVAQLSSPKASDYH